MKFQPSQYSYGATDEPAVPTVTITTPEGEQVVLGQQPKPKLTAGKAAVAVGVIGGLLLLGPFVVTPWIVKQFKPDWSYGKRVATGFVVSFGVGAITQIARAAGGKEA